MKPLADITPVSQPQVELEILQMNRTTQLAAEHSFAATSGNLERQLRDTKGRGSPLPNEVRDFMELRIQVTKVYIKLLIIFYN